MSELISNLESKPPSNEGFIMEPIVLEDFMLMHDRALSELMDDIDLDYRDKITTTSKVNFRGLDSYVAEVESGYSIAPYDSELMILDTGTSGEMIGYGFVTFFNNGVARVGDTFTNKQYRRQGLGRRRLDLMNMLTSQLRGQVLHSGMSIEPEAERLWLTLVEEGLAESYQTQSGFTRWRFKADLH